MLFLALVLLFSLFVDVYALLVVVVVCFRVGIVAWCLLLLCVMCC